MPLTQPGLAAAKASQCPLILGATTCAGPGLQSQLKAFACNCSQWELRKARPGAGPGIAAIAVPGLTRHENGSGFSSDATVPACAEQRTLSCFTSGLPVLPSNPSASSVILADTISVSPSKCGIVLSREPCTDRL